MIEKLGLSAKAFSNIIEESPTTTHNYVSSRNAEPRATYLASIIHHFAHVSAHWLLTGQGEALLSEMAEPPAVYQTQKKNTGTIVGTISGGKNKFTTLQDCEVANANLRKEVEQLRAHLTDKEKLIRLLEASKPNP